MVIHIHIDSMKDFSELKETLSASAEGVLGFGDKRSARNKTVSKIERLLGDAILEKIGEPQSFNTEKVVKQILFNCGVRRGDLRLVSVAKRVFAAVDGIVHASGSAARAYEAESKIDGNWEENFVKSLTMGVPIETKGEQKEVNKAIRIGGDATRLVKVRQQFQDIFGRLFESLQSCNLSSHDERLTEVLIGNILSYYPFVDPQERKTINIPQKIDGSWVNVEYCIEKIALTDGKRGSTVYAYGLKPTDKSSKAQSILLFLATTHVPAFGSLLTHFTDFVPGFTPGETIYNKGKTEIQGWIDGAYKYSGSKAVKTYGTSLGGSMAFIAASHQPDKVEVFAYNPPASLLGVSRRYEKNIKNLDCELPKIEVFRQENDPVSLVGSKWLRGVKMFRVLPEKQHKLKPSHSMHFSGQHNVTILEIDAARDNARISRKVATLVYQIFSAPIFVFNSLKILIRMIQIALNKAPVK